MLHPELTIKVKHHKNFREISHHQKPDRNLHQLKSNWKIEQLLRTGESIKPSSFCRLHHRNTTRSWRPTADRQIQVNFKKLKANHRSPHPSQLLHQHYQQLADTSIKSLEIKASRKEKLNRVLFSKSHIALKKRKQTFTLHQHQSKDLKNCKSTNSN